MPEMQDENVNDLVMKVAEEIHANVTRHDIDRAHRVGRKDDSVKTDGRDDDFTDGQEYNIYRSHIELIENYHVSLKKLLKQGISKSRILGRFGINSLEIQTSLIFQKFC